MSRKIGEYTISLCLVINANMICSRILEARYFTIKEEHWMESTQISREAGSGPENAISFHGSGTTLFGIQLVNLFFIIITLGVYYFWAKVKVRKYIWSQLEFSGDRFCFHGTGNEILIGWIKAAIVFGIPFLIFSNMPSIMNGSPVSHMLAYVLTWGIIGIFIPYAIVGTRRYRLSRTSLLGIRFSFRGKWWDFAVFYCGIAFLLIVTLGLYYPYFAMKKTGYLTERSFFGNRHFAFDGTGSDLFGSFIISVLLALPTMFLSLLWFKYRKDKYTFDHTFFETVRLRSSITFGGVLWLYCTNLLILIFTLGFGAPFVKIRNLHYYIGNLSIEGGLDMTAIVQEAADVSAMGEEVGDLLGMDFDLG